MICVVHLKLITVFSLLEGIFYIYSFISCHVQFLVCTPEVSAMLSESIEHYQEALCCAEERGEQL